MLNQFSRTQLLFGEAGMEKLQRSRGAMGDIHDIRDASKEFELDCKVRHLSPKTIDNYTKQLR